MTTDPTTGRHLDAPRVVCSTAGCDVELLADRKHVPNLIDAGWTCTRCRRERSA
ncbi:hypothetical protein [Nocardioides sp. YIM 152588]|uniref:hypothetical protein n=1 Tax=Nocardioides sp. YIM 152588 TaxID=3158259 RepID=UPI0032E468AE